MKYLVPLLLFFIGATYYVSPSGSDSNSGTTLPSAFRQPQKAATLAKAGDTVILEPGTFSGFTLSYDTPQAGTSLKHIVFETDPSAAGWATITSRNGKTPTGIDLEPGSDYVDIVDIAMTNDGSITKAGIKATGNHDTITGCNVKGVGGIGGIFTDNANFAVISGNTVTGTLGTNTTGHAIYVSGTCTGVQVVGNTLNANGYHGIHLNGDASEGGVGAVTNTYVANNVISNNPGNGINGDGVQNSRFENNLITSFTKYSFSFYTIDAGVGSSGNVFVNNTVSGPNIAQFQNNATGNVWFDNVNIGKAPVVDSSSSLFQSNNSAGPVDASFHLTSEIAGVKSITQGGTTIYAPLADLSGLGQPSGKWDVGCYQFKGAWPGDANQDGHVNYTDVQLQQASWNGHGGWAQGDFNGDGKITFADKQILMSNYGK